MRSYHECQINKLGAELNPHAEADPWFAAIHRQVAAGFLTVDQGDDQLKELATLREKAAKLDELSEYVQNGASFELMARQLGLSGEDADMHFRALLERSRQMELIIENIYHIKAGEPIVDTDDQVTSMIAALMELGHRDKERDAKAAAWDRVYAELAAHLCVTDELSNQRLEKVGRTALFSMTAYEKQRDHPHD